MKLTERGSGLYLEGLVEGDVRFTNMAARPTGSQWEDPNNIKHAYVVNIHDKEIADALADYGFNVKERVKSDTGEFDAFTLEFRAYPGIRVNAKTGKEEVWPKVMLKSVSSDSYKRLDIPEFSEVDSVNIESANIRFHLYHNKRYNRNIAVIDELWVQLKANAGRPDEDYYESMLNPSYNDEVPFE